jgi:uncharacterized BrkB/YihY/UPF0761 family membrane protein
MRARKGRGEDAEGAPPAPADLDPAPGMVRRAVRAWYSLPDRRADSPLLDIVLRLLQRHREMAGSLLAGALGYRLFLVALPLTLIAVGLLGFGESSGAADAESITRELGVNGLMANVITTSGEQAVGLRWFTLAGGFVLLLWATHALLRALRTVHALAWTLPIKRLPRPVLGVTLASAVLLVSTVASGGVNDATTAWPYWAVAANAAVFLGYAAVWLWVSVYLPSRVERWTQLLPGAALFAVGVKAIQMFTVYYVAPFLDERAEVYGVLGYASMALLVLYAFGELAVLSALLNAAVFDHRHR